MVSKKKSGDIAEEIASASLDKYGDPQRRKVRPPMDQMVQSLLWRYTSVRRGTRGMRQLKRHFVDWNEVRVSPVREVQNAMSSANWAWESARHLKKVLDSLFHLRNSMALDFLEELTVAQARTFMRSIQEVPRDLGDEVLLFIRKADLLPVGEDTARMCYRLGLVDNDRATLKNQKALMKLWDTDVYPVVAQFFADNARTICRQDEPRHGKCSLDSLCPRVGL